MSYDALNDNQQYAVSYELLALVRWLVANDSGRLKKIVGRALQAGLKEEIECFRAGGTDHEAMDDLQQSILDLFVLLEGTLVELLHEQAEKKARERNLMPAIDQIDTTICDDATVRVSVDRAATKIAANPSGDPRDILFKELLKSWNPRKKQQLLN